MKILKNLFNKKDLPIKTNEDFWHWFQKNAKKFHKIIKQQNNIEENLFGPLSHQLSQLMDGFYFLMGMYDDHTAELILTPDGDIKLMVFVEELVESAPHIDGWKITALKPEQNIENSNIEMAGYKFTDENLSFYSNEHPDYPDEIDITIVYNDFKEEDKSNIINGIYIFLDNFLGELNFATTIDHIEIIGKEQAVKELIPMEKLKAFLIWRQKEFIEKYEGTLHHTEEANFKLLEAELTNGNKLLATINSDILNWDKKVSHPWIAKVEIKFGGLEGNGMPDNETYNDLNVIEEGILEELKDADGYLNIGRQTADGSREIYFACKEFRKPSKVLLNCVKKHSATYDISYDIYKDKYWQSFNRFLPNCQ